VFSGAADDRGVVSPQLLQYTLAAGAHPETPERTDLTPHRIIVEKEGKKAEKEVPVDKAQEVAVQP
jgi:hypothetical protein